jgi:multimeric flavodoxin WrbA
MKAILLDGSHAHDSTGERVRTALASQLQARGWDVEHVILRERKIGDCAGDYLCWVRTPGVCKTDDDNRVIAAAIIASDLMVYLTPVTFGGYSSALKRMVDHQIQNISPFFTTIEGETHHQKRYERYPDFLVVGWTDAPNPQAEAVFRHLAQRNGINFRVETHVGVVIPAAQSDQDMLTSARNWLNELDNGRSSPRVELSANGRKGNGASEIRRALLLVGSPRREKSTSSSLGEYLLEQLRARSIQTETIYVHTALRSPEGTQAMIDAVNAVDLVALTFPLYVDSLPAPVIEALEHIAAHRQSREARPQLFAAIANCGFPEALHNTTVLAICATFARQAGFEWAGSLSLGGGEAVNGQPLAQAGGRTIRMRKSLEMATEALARGQAIPTAAQDLMGKPIVPHWAYRMGGKRRWNKQAKHYGAGKLLKQRPYSATAPR